MKRKRIYFLIVIIGLIGIWWYNTFTIKITEVYIADERIKDEIKIVQITDLHGFKFGKDNRYLINKRNSFSPFTTLNGFSTCLFCERRTR